ncbi:ABC transporter substrate-binding protein [Maritimibacter alexandrii]|uniref:ABC transporter substrate-binding protein n=1 Tax=Maritimibacter alexandrii TaxID=2570355 RepID=UPI00110962B7|nr:ABC transporter substrate-binding protein [Maritimibacter alexandrii]
MFRIVVTLLWVWMAGVAPAFADASLFVQRLSGKISDAAETSVSQTALILGRYFDINAMAFAALPEAYRPKATQAYVTAYHASVAGRFYKEFQSAGEGGLRVLGVRENGNLTLVGTEVHEGGRRLMVEFYLRRDGTSFKVVNVALEGLLITKQQQRDFQPILISGDIPGLINWLERTGS